MNGIATCVSGPTKVDIFWLAPDFKINHKSGNGTQWNVSSDELGGMFITVPAAVATNSAQLGSPQLLDLFAVGADFAMYTKQFAQGAWAGVWLNLQGAICSISWAKSFSRMILQVDALGCVPDRRRWRSAGNGRRQARGGSGCLGSRCLDRRNWFAVLHPLAQSYCL